MNDFYIHALKLPPHINGCTIPNDDGTFDIYLNLSICEERQIETLQHEIAHIRAEHFYKDCPACLCEDEIRALLRKVVSR